MERSLVQEWMTDEEVFSLLISAVIHDFRVRSISHSALLLSSGERDGTLLEFRVLISDLCLHSEMNLIHRFCTCVKGSSWKRDF